MTATMQRTTHLAAAEAELAAVDRQVEAIEREVSPALDKCAEAQLALDELNNTAPNSPAAKKLQAAIAALGPQVSAARRRLEVVQRRRTAAAQRVTSEHNAIALAKQAIADQTQRVARQAEAVATVRRLVSEKETALDLEERRLVDLYRDLATLTGDEDHADRGAL